MKPDNKIANSRSIAGLLLISIALTGCLDLSTKEKAVTDTGQTPDNSATGNQAPSISGRPSVAVMVGDTYQFQPIATDSDGDSLTFAIENRPSWGSFDTSSGELSGQPSLGDVGTYDNIAISVSDGEFTASLPRFSVSVDQTGTASVSLSWNPPTTNVDGSQLTDLAGYKIYYGRNPGSYTDSVRIDNPGITNFVVDNLVADTYYFAASAINASGFESRLSSETQKVAN